MTNLEHARIVAEAFRPLLHQTTLWARSGDKGAAVDLMKQMATRDMVLKQLGYAVSNTGNVVVYRPAAGIEKRKNILALKASEGDVESAKKLLELMSG